MISNQILQSTLDSIKGISKKDMAVLDPAGNELAGTMSRHVAGGSSIQQLVQSEEEMQKLGDCLLYKICDGPQPSYILIVDGTDPQSEMIGSMTALQLRNLLVAYRERFDRDNFIKNLLLDNLLLVDIYSRAKKQHVATDAHRVVFVVETEKENDNNTLDKLKALFPEKQKDFVTFIDERHIVVVKELGEQEHYEALARIADSMLRTVDGGNIRVSYGTIVHELKEVSRSYKEANLALEVGRIFFEDSNVVAYNTLGIGRLIYQLPIPLCRMFIREIFGQRSPDEFDEETLTTISKFFENSLNVSETSRQLFIHRNTLVYRLDKLQKTTGLDLRVFEDAITFKISLMVSKYMKYMEKQDF